MAAFARLSFLIRRPPTAGGLLAGLSAAAAVALLPTDTLEHLVWTSGVAALVPAAQPPLGTTARALLALGGGVIVGAVVWAALFLLFGPDGFLAGRAGEARQPKPTRHRRPRLARGRKLGVRRGDSHPDAPLRRPMTAADLGTPLMEIGAGVPVADEFSDERPLPRDLDQPLAAFDPAAVPLVPREPVRPVPPLAPGERLETFQLTPPPPRSDVRPAKREPASAQSIETLLRRLEEGANRRSARA